MGMEESTSLTTLDDGRGERAAALGLLADVVRAVRVVRLDHARRPDLRRHLGRVVADHIAVAALIHPDYDDSTFVVLFLVAGFGAGQQLIHLRRSR